MIVRRRTATIAVVLVVAAVFSAGLALAAAGQLDTTFAGDGTKTTDFGFGSDAAHGVAVQSDGKIVAVGQAYNGVSIDFGLARYKPGGGLDTAFSGDGLVFTTWPQRVGGNPTQDFGQDVAIQQGDGKIVVAGSTAAPGASRNFAVARYSTGGTLDGAFSGDGRQTTDFNQGQDDGYAVAIQDDGKIVVAGVTSTQSSSSFAVARYGTNGTLDTTFSGDGRVTIGFGAGDPDVARGVAIQDDGMIVVVGFTCPNPGFESCPDTSFALARLTSLGTLDTTFSGDGKQTTAFAEGPAFGQDVALQTNGRIVVAGTAGDSPSEFAVARYGTGGLLDSTFHGDGRHTVAFGQSDARGLGVALQGDGKIVVGGVVGNGSATDFALARLLTGGNLDTVFGGTGKVTTAIGPTQDAGEDLALQADGKIVVAGTTLSRTNFDFALARYLAA